MGAYLSTPNTTKFSHNGDSEEFSYGVSAMQGWRLGMEDAHVARIDIDGDKTAFFGVFDGHGGKEVAQFCARHMQPSLVRSKSYRENRIQEALEVAFLRMDKLLMTEEGRRELEDSILAESDPLWSGPKPGEDGYGRAGGDCPAGAAKPSPDELIKSIAERSTGGADARSKLEMLLKSSSKGSSSKKGGGDAGGRAARPTVASLYEHCDDDDEVRKRIPMSSSGYPGPSAGCTAVVALVKNGTLYVANAGDSRCIISHKGKVKEMTHDHKPDDAIEKTRILNAGGFIADGRVNGSLNLSRAIGDMEYKRNPKLPPADQIVVAMPEVRMEKLKEGDEFAVLACDGVWDVMSCQEVVNFVRERLVELVKQIGVSFCLRPPAGTTHPRAHTFSPYLFDVNPGRQGKPLSSICEEIFNHCLAPDTGGQGLGCDNMSAVIVLFKNYMGKGLVRPAGSKIPPPPPIGAGILKNQQPENQRV
eukprot:jgi/Mesvir1/18450/Mv14305-RA.1